MLSFTIARTLYDASSYHPIPIAKRNHIALRSIQLQRAIGNSMAMDQRSGCPINLTTEILGDRWSMVVVRDVMLMTGEHSVTFSTIPSRGSPPTFSAAD